MGAIFTPVVRIIDVKNINLQIKQHKNMFLNFHKKHLEKHAVHNQCYAHWEWEVGIHIFTTLITWNWTENE